MAALLSRHERAFIRGGVDAGVRADGRARQDYRSFDLHAGGVAMADGSARLRIAVRSPARPSLLAPVPCRAHAAGLTTCVL